MPGTTDTLLIYYLGLGFVVLLGWAATVPDHQLDERAARRYLRWTTVAAVIGLLHPAISLGARDIVGQVGVDMPDNNPALEHQQRRAAKVVNILAVVSLMPVVVLIAISST